MAAFTFDQLYRADLASFAKCAFYELSPQQKLGITYFIDIMADALQGCLDRGTRRLIINAPPRSLKSHCASVAALVFALGRDPTLKIIVVAGSRVLAAELQRRVVALMRSPRCRALFPHLQPTVIPGEIVLPHGGSILYRAIGQSLIGRGADLIVIDDPIAPLRAQDDAEREAVNAWYDAEVVPRLNDKAGGVIVLVMQRLHLNDLTGHVLKRGGWTEIVLPAIAIRDESWQLHRRRTVTRLKGEPLQPDREGVERLIAILREIDAYNFLAQYQQRPVPAPGLQRVVYFNTPRPPNWQPEMGLGRSGFAKVRTSDNVLFEIFGIGPQPLYSSTSSPFSDEEWEAVAILQQAKLVSAVRDDGARNGLHAGR